VRLGALFLTAAALAASSLAAQGRQRLPWERLQPLSWLVGSRVAQDDPPWVSEPSAGPVEVWLSGDGTLRIRDARGILRLRTGLPGRPLKVWRDGGLALAAVSGTWMFPDDSPLSQGPGGLRWCAEDFRPF
jgi:hypothetical protein